MKGLVVQLDNIILKHRLIFTCMRILVHHISVDPYLKLVGSDTTDNFIVL